MHPYKHACIHTLCYTSCIRGYSVVLYNNKKYTIIKLHWNKNIHMCYEANRNIYVSYTVT